MRELLITVLLLGSSLPAFTKTCSLSKSEVLKIGCTTDCGRFNRWALKSMARRLGYKIKTYNLYSEKEKISYKDMDAIIIPGGADIDPKYYKDKVEPELKKHIEDLDHLVNYSTEGEIRDPFEFNLLQDYFSNKSANYTPILGICRGMQMLSVSQGIPLIIDIKEEIGIKNRIYTLDKVYFTSKETLGYNIVKKNKFRAVELHHQNPRLDYFRKHKERWPHIEITATSNKDRISEVIEFQNRPVFGVQFHPEYTFGRVRRNIFKWILKKGCEKKLKDKK